MIGNKSNGSNKQFDSLKLTFKLTFLNWEEFKNWIYKFALKEDFNYKIRTSKINQDIMWRAIYECTKSETNTLQITSDLTK